MDQVQATSYTDYDPWYGTNLEFTELNPSMISFESHYVPFGDIRENPLLVDDTKNICVRVSL